MLRGGFWDFSFAICFDSVWLMVWVLILPFGVWVLVDILMFDASESWVYSAEILQGVAL